jgi:hypothetical protein
LFVRSPNDGTGTNNLIDDEEYFDRPDLSGEIKANQKMHPEKMLAKQEAFIKELRNCLNGNQAKEKARLLRMEALLGLRPYEELKEAK